MKKPTPPQCVNGIWFTEDDLSTAIFHNATITTTGQCTRAEARQAARIMLAAPELLAALHELAAIGEAGVLEKRETGKPTWHVLDAVKTITRAAIAKAKGIERVTFKGIDGFNRPIFQSIDFPKNHFGSTDTLFSRDAPESEVLAKLTPGELTFFGSSFGCEPEGHPAPGIIILTNKEAKAISKK